MDAQGINGDTGYSLSNRKNVRRSAAHRLFCAALLAVGVAGPSIARADSASWNVAGDGIWSDRTNWSPATISTAPNGPDQIATFGSAVQAGGTITLDRYITLGGLAFAGPNPYAITPAAGSVLTFQSGSGSAMLVADGTAAHSINAGLSLSSDLLVTQNSTGALTLSNIATQSGKTYGLTKAGTGTLILNGSSTYTGATSISDGTLQIGNGGIRASSIQA